MVTVFIISVGVHSPTDNKKDAHGFGQEKGAVKNYHGDDSQDFVILLQAGASAGELFAK